MLHTSSRERRQDYCLAACGDKVFAVPVAGLVRVVAAGECSRRADLAPPLEGFVELGGRRVPVARLDHWIAALDTAADAEHVAIINTGAGELGLLFERVRGLATILETEIRTSPAQPSPVLAGLWAQRSYTVHILDPGAFAADVRRWQDGRENGGTRPAAASGESHESGGRTQGFCFFERRGRHFALPVLSAREVVAGEPVTPVPQAPEHVLGVVNLRGHLLPLINADSFLGLPASVVRADYEALVVERDGVQLGILVDRVGDVRPIDLADVRPAPPQAGPVYRGVWSGATADVFLVDTDHIVALAVAAATHSFQRTVAALGGLEEDADAIPDCPS